MYGRADYSTNMHEYYSGQYDMNFEGQPYGQLVGSGVNFDSRHYNQDAGFLHTWQTNGRYLHQVTLSDYRHAVFFTYTQQKHAQVQTSA